MTTTQAIREALIAAMPIATANYGEPPDIRHIYLPPAHAKALRLECNLVIGARGVGKSTWAAALESDALRKTLGQEVPELEQADASIGFGVQGNMAAYPDMDTFAALMAQGFQPRLVWRAVVARWLAGVLREQIPSDVWPSTVKWVAQHPEAMAQLLERASRHFQSRGRMGLIIFDALDRTSRDWGQMDGIVRDLLQVVLQLKSYPRLHAKVFLREDQADRPVMNFPDASKLKATQVALQWGIHDLHGLLWQHLCNASSPYGEQLRKLYQDTLGTEPRRTGAPEAPVWAIADDVRRVEGKQRDLFASLAGPWMGRDPRRGVPYIWSVSHLADGHGLTSPRSFLAGIREAAEDSRDRYTAHEHALHFESIKRGMQKASEIRVQEIGEDYPWIKPVMDPLRRLTVPCEFSAVQSRWEQAFPQGFNTSDVSSPPSYQGEGWPGVRKDLERMGVLTTMKDERVNLPDLYRVGFGLGRRGGVKPVVR